MKITILGSGTSHGVPMIGCDCEVCHSTNPKNKRFRSSITVTTEAIATPSNTLQAASSLLTSSTRSVAAGNVGTGNVGTGSDTLGSNTTESIRTILVDATPELRLQALATDLRRVDAVLITHTHADHVMGLDDMRRFSDLSNGEIPVYGDANSLADIRRIYPYIFKETLQEGGGKPRLALHEVEPAFTLFGLNIQSFYVMHGKLPILAYRFDQFEQLVQQTREDQSETQGRGRAVGVGADDPGREARGQGLLTRSFAYVTDVNKLPDEAMQKLQGLDLLVLDAVRYEPHSTHYGFYEALDIIAELKPARALLTHLSHHFDQDTANALAPENVSLAYDGQVIVL